MSALQYVKRLVIPAAFSLLPEKMDKPEAKTMMLAICLQESRFEFRRQIGGPARGFPQFEEGGGWRGVLNHPATKEHAANVLAALAYPSPEFEAMTHNDVLAIAFARLLLWTHPRSLPGPAQADEGWQQYIDCWRPGKPHRHTWDAFYKQAWDELKS